VINVESDAELEIHTDRLDLCPLRAAHATELFEVLADPRLYTFTGKSSPPSVDWLRTRYERLESRRSPDGAEFWLNWVVIIRDGRTPVGYVQASISSETADLAWVIGIPWQGRGYASEAARGMVAWIRRHFPGVMHTASIHPDHAASATVAKRMGLAPTDDYVDGEIVWRSSAPNHREIENSL